MPFIPLRSLLTALFIVATSCCQIGCGGSGASSAATTPTFPTVPPVPADILAFMHTRPEISEVTEVATTLAGARFFRLKLTQPVDHTVSGGATYAQFATLLHRSSTVPVVLATTGYSIGTNPSQGEPTRILTANQLTMEHRFFATSTPSPADWTKLSIAQAAADEHRLVTVFKPYYTGKWINTGGSKGGMTALFHRRFYPNDVDATLAYVAPISLSQGDPRYVSFVDARGGMANRAAIEAWQQAVLTKRAEVRALLEADAARSGATLSFFGSDKALEFALLEAPFTLWQYGNASLAAQVPPPTANAQQLYDFLDAASMGVLSAWSDGTLEYYKAYYQQSANQFGYPGVEENHLTGLLFPGQDLPANYPPLGVSKAYDDGAAMRDIQTWISTAAERVILVYGENDPWTAGALDVNPAAQGRNVKKYTVPSGNHGSNLAGLTLSDRNEAYQLLSQWMGVSIAPADIAIALPSKIQGTPQDFSETFVHIRRRH